MRPMIQFISPQKMHAGMDTWAKYKDLSGWKLVTDIWWRGCWILYTRSTHPKSAHV